MIEEIDESNDVTGFERESKRPVPEIVQLQDQAASRAFVSHVFVARLCRASLSQNPTTFLNNDKSVATRDLRL